MLGIKSKSKIDYIDVVKFTPAPNTDWVMYRYPGGEFCNLTKLIVGPGQRAICVHNGRVEGEFANGITTLSTEVYPFLQQTVSKVHGGLVPYTMEIYFFNSTVQNRRQWGTKVPAQLEDPKSGLLIHLRSYGSYNVRLGDFQFFLTQFSGAISDNGVITWAVISEKLGGIIQQTLQKTLGVFLVKQNIGALQLPAFVEEFSVSLLEASKPYFATYGFELIDLLTESINFPDEDMQSLKKRREMDTLGTSHIIERQLDIQQKWAGNEGAAGGMAAAGMGLGIGLMGMQQTMQNFQGTMNQTPQTQQPTNNGAARFCSECGAAITDGDKFCKNCGKPLSNSCPNCHETVALDARFCPKCGTKLK